MEKKIPLYEIILGFVIGALLVAMLYTGYPMRWFITQKFSYVSSTTVPFLLNYVLVILLTIVFVFVLRKMSLGLSSKNFNENLRESMLVMALLLATGLISYYAGLHSSLGYSASPISVVLEGFLLPVVKNFAILMVFLTFVLGSFLSLPWKKYGNLFSAICMVVIYMAATILGNLNLTRMAIVLHTCIAFGIGFYGAGFRLRYENSLIPSAVFAVFGMSRIVFSFAGDPATPLISIFMISGVFLILGSISLGGIILRSGKNNDIIENK